MDKKVVDKLLNNIYEEISYHNTYMSNSNWFTLPSFTDIKAAVARALFIGVFAMIAFIVHAGSIFGLDVKSLTNTGAIAALTFLASLATTIFTTGQGNFVGMMKIKK